MASIQDPSLLLAELRRINPNVVDDLSQRAIEIGRLLDRLPPGTHMLVIIKDEVRAKEWKLEVSTIQHSRSITLPKKLHE